MIGEILKSSPRIGPQLCDWPGCVVPAYAASHELDGAFVCPAHFALAKAADHFPVIAEQAKRIGQLRKMAVPVVTSEPWNG